MLLECGLHCRPANDKRLLVLYYNKKEAKYYNDHTHVKHNFINLGCSSWPVW